jgi:periplasmic glucans biosynthesis protein
VSVRSSLRTRRGGEKLGIAPLNSMFFYGENTNERPDDYRSEVHDSDGLLVAFRSGEWLWRPLKNPQKLEVNALDAPDPVGFGLMQRDINFHDYEDLEARYDLRPSVWITPNGRWGEGHVELIQIPTASGMNDNIMAFWVPSAQLDSGEARSYSYSMTWQFPDVDHPPSGRVVATRTARGRDENCKKFVIDFAGGQLESFAADKPLIGVVTVGEGAKLVEQQLFKNRVTKGWRLVFQVLLDEQGSMDRVLPNRRVPVEMRAFLKDGESAVTETWSYSYQR